MFLVLKTPETLAKSLGNSPLRRVIAVTFQVQLYLNHSLQWIFFFQHSRNLEMIFSKNTSERLLRQLEPVSLLHSSEDVSSLIILIQAGVCSIEIAILKIFAIFTGKHQCWSLFSINSIFKSICERLLLYISK